MKKVVVMIATFLLVMSSRVLANEGHDHGEHYMPDGTYMSGEMGIDGHNEGNGRLQAYFYTSSMEEDTLGVYFPEENKVVFYRADGSIMAERPAYSEDDFWALREKQRVMAEEGLPEEAYAPRDAQIIYRAEGLVIEYDSDGNMTEREMTEDDWHPELTSFYEPIEIAPLFNYSGVAGPLPVMTSPVKGNEGLQFNRAYYTTDRYNHNRVAFRFDSASLQNSRVNTFFRNEYGDDWMVTHNLQIGGETRKNIKFPGEKYGVFLSSSTSNNLTVSGAFFALI